MRVDYSQTIFRFRGHIDDGFFSNAASAETYGIIIEDFNEADSEGLGYYGFDGEYIVGSLYDLTGTLNRGLVLAESQRAATIRGIIYRLLKEAGESGLTVKDLAEKMGKKLTHLHSWFHSTGSQLNWIRKVGVGHYAYQEPNLQNKIPHLRALYLVEPSPECPGFLQSPGN